MEASHFQLPGLTAPACGLVQPAGRPLRNSAARTETKRPASTPCSLIASWYRVLCRTWFARSWEDGKRGNCEKSLKKNKNHQLRSQLSRHGPILALGKRTWLPRSTLQMETSQRCCKLHDSCKLIQTDCAWVLVKKRVKIWFEFRSALIVPQDFMVRVPT